MPPLELSPEEFRVLADRNTEVATDFVTSLESRQTVSPTSASDTANAFDLPLLEDGIGDAITDDLREIGQTCASPDPSTSRGMRATSRC